MHKKIGKEESKFWKVPSFSHTAQQETEKKFEESLLKSKIQKIFITATTTNFSEWVKYIEKKVHLL